MQTLTLIFGATWDQTQDLVHTRPVSYHLNMMILYSENLLNSFINSNSFLAESLGFPNLRSCHL
jgi:hypothetical protein